MVRRLLPATAVAKGACPDGRAFWFTAALVLFTAALPAPSYGAPEGDRQVVIVAADEADARIAHTREAIAFWNQTLERLGLPSRLREARLVVASPLNRPLETFARQISLRAGRYAPDQFPPPSPPALANLDGDIVVLLSRQQLMSFAWALEDMHRYFVGIRNEIRPQSPEDASAFIRNVIAHELGHALGLTHNDNPATLMCGGCESIHTRDGGAFRPLIAEDRERLLEELRAP
jgi:hypothetical protein